MLAVADNEPTMTVDDPISNKPTSDVSAVDDATVDRGFLFDEQTLGRSHWTPPTLWLKYGFGNQ